MTWEMAIAAARDDVIAAARKLSVASTIAEDFIDVDCAEFIALRCAIMELSIVEQQAKRRIDQEI